MSIDNEELLRPQSLPIGTTKTHSASLKRRGDLEERARREKTRN